MDPTSNLVNTGDGSNTLISTKYGQSYHSIHGAKTESIHVFLQASGVAHRCELGLATSILEIGYGLGLNFLLTADHALQRKAIIDYTAIEFDPVSTACQNNLDYDSLVSTDGLTNMAFKALDTAGKTHYSSDYTRHKGVSLTVLNQDLAESKFRRNAFDAVYLDPFSPDVNPECWSERAMTQYYQALKPGGVLSTYSVKGSVKRAMLAVGLEPRKLPGPPGKREILVATRLSEV